MTDAQAQLRYPTADRDDVVDDLHGHQVADPYRWLEDPADARTEAWSATQDQLARTWLDALPGREAVAERMRSLLAAGSVSAPAWRAGRAFFTRREPDQEFPVLYVRDRDGSERVLLDVAALDPSGLTTLDSWSPSLEGDRLAYQISVGGDEESLLHVLDVTTGELVEGPIDRCRYSTIAWMPGGAEYFYVRRLAPELVPDGEEQFHRRVWRHRVGTDPDADLLVHGEGLDHTFYYGTRVSRDGRWLVIEGSPGTARRDSVWIADLTAGAEVPEMRQVVDTSDGYRVGAWVERDGRLYVMTTLDAPRWRLCVADPERPEPEHWTELIAEQPDSVLEAVRWFDTGDGDPQLVVLRTRHAVSEVTLHDPATGERTGEVPLPGTGQVTALTSVDEDTEHDRDRLWIGWTDFATPPCVHAYAHRTGEVALDQRAPGAVELPAVHTQQVTYRSLDGTPVRMFLLSPAAEPDRPRPVFMTGYGGFSLSREPGYTPSALAWVAAGGVWALPSLRGGGEEGEQWHEAGMREQKQHTFDDFHAAAQHLIDEGWTTADQLAISGGSNGGLLVGAALTQRPDLYRAVVCSAPLLDMVRYEKFLLGRTWNDEYGTADDPEELGWLLSYSPYHNVAEQTDYPSVLFTVFESDTRVDPNHARKMCAALQHATSSDPAKRPILLRRETEVGHSARSVSRTVGLATDQLAFLAEATGLILD
ncbi:prolyl oligopeptidase [Saccharopolyspora antimicrobica]|uniref:prolyl oligopeptidase n=1 Tax=Saccharopolyspora antimicrobica TaxID=455193 RepID=A0A1I4Z342_9PSEU|nr:prolyl oligopeptidase family serine peptidase [Saccharopolyspora antimicrobica]RKT82908.1 prolyl oligopeptidase [Saccharopolyspora antimicrobica]SFN44618.1 prolyl oligopeptidase [Saccharopolyspora antimicrobica]